MKVETSFSKTKQVTWDWVAIKNQSLDKFSKHTKWVFFVKINFSFYVNIRKFRLFSFPTFSQLPNRVTFKLNLIINDNYWRERERDLK